VIDAHNHLQQLENPDAILATCRTQGVRAMLTNGTSAKDWPLVAEIARRSEKQQQETPLDYPTVIPSFGLHPWQVPERSENWIEQLEKHLLAFPNAAIGECGLDRWKKPFDLPDQIHCLRTQIDLAITHARPLTIHCLQAWGPLLEVLQSYPSLPPFLLHAYSGSSEMVPSFVALGAYFSFNGYFLHERKASVRRTFQQIPPDRLLIESDAPAMLPPPEFITHPLTDEQNHPANLPLILPPLARLLEIQEEKLVLSLAKNFQNFTRDLPS